MRVPERRFFGCCCFEYVDSRVPIHELGIFHLVLVARLQRLLKPGLLMTSAPVITKENFDRRVAAMRAKGAYDGPDKFEERRSSKEADDIKNTWNRWLDHFYATRTDLKPVGGYKCINGGHTNRHGLNPVMYTLMEDWFKEPHPQMPKRQKT
jgi:hypothetical protein